LTAADNGASVRAQPGDELVVRLPESPGTGYRWHIDAIEGVVELEGDSFDLGGNTAPGAGGTREFRFRPTAPGTGRIALKHWREWEGDSSVTARFAADVTVAD
jgi:inhibitor of cysteine peptidase